MRTREPDGKKTRELGACPAAAETKLDGVNDGKNGGRSCWAIAGTLSEGETQGTYAQKLGNCLKYDFHAFVRSQQHGKYASTKKILDIIHGKITASCLSESKNKNLKKVV
jgi:hypothetical protein